MTAANSPEAIAFGRNFSRCAHEHDDKLFVLDHDGAYLLISLDACAIAPHIGATWGQMQTDVCWANGMQISTLTIDIPTCEMIAARIGKTIVHIHDVI